MVVVEVLLIHKLVDHIFNVKNNIEKKITSKYEHSHGVGGVGGGGVGGGTNSLLFRRSCIHVRNIYGFTTENNVLKMQK